MSATPNIWLTTLACLSSEELAGSSNKKPLKTWAICAHTNDQTRAQYSPLCQSFAILLLCTMLLTTCARRCDCRAIGIHIGLWVKSCIAAKPPRSCVSRQSCVLLMCTTCVQLVPEPHASVSAVVQASYSTIEAL